MASGQLLRHLDWLASGRVKVVPLSEIVGADERNDSIAITFDDGLTNFGELAAPHLIERGLPATVFLATAHVGTYNAWDDENRQTIPRLSVLSWDEIRGLSEKGIDFGGHGHTHIPLRGLSANIVRDEVAGCHDRISAELGRRPRTFAYPYGACDDASVEAVASTFDVACTTELRVVSAADSSRRLPRVDMYYFKDISIGDIWGTVAFAPYVKLRAIGRAVRSLGRKR